MRMEPATLLIIVMSIFGFFFLLLPLGAVIQQMPGIWRADRGAGVLLVGVIGTTAFLFILLFIGFAAVGWGWL